MPGCVTKPKRLAILLFMFCHGGFSSFFAQCTNGTQPECACETAPVLCSVDELDGYQFSMTTFQHPGDGPTPICPGAFLSQSNNPTWFAFTAWCTNLRLLVTSSNCEEIQNYIGFQIAIYTDCSFTDVVACNADPDDCNTNNKILNMTGLTIGDVYYFLVDGCLGSYCDVTIDVIGVCGEEEIGPWISPVMGAPYLCAGDDEAYSIETVQGAGLYHWFIDGTQVAQTASPNINLNWPAPGTYELCIDASNDPCAPVTDDPMPLCTMITVYETDAGMLNVTPTILCVNETATITSVGFITRPDNVQMLLITDSAGLILEVIPASSGTFVSPIPGTYFVYSYNFIPAIGVLPIVGSMVSDIDCNASCCDLENHTITIGLIEAAVSNIVCDDNDTGNDPDDDTFTFSLLVTGPDLGSPWHSVDGSLNGMYGTILACGPYPVSAGMLQFDLQDQDVAGCLTSINVTAPLACSFCLQTIDAGLGGTLTCVEPAALLTGTSSEMGSYQWTGPDFFQSNTLSVTVNDSGWYFFMTEFINECTAVDSVFVDMNIEFPLANAGPDLMLDCNQSDELLYGSASSGNSIQYAWLDPEGTLISTQPTILVNLPGLYTLQVTNFDNGCFSVDVAEVFAAPDAIESLIASVTPENCFGENDGQIDITNITGGTLPYIYTLNETSNNATGQFSALSPGYYVLQITDALGCMLDTFFTISPGIELQIILPPEMELTEGQNGQIQAIVNTPAIDLSSILWNPPGLLGCDTCLVTTIEILTNQTFQLTVIHENGCVATAEINILFIPRLKIYIPNAFSPDGDGYNDFFTLFSNDRVQRILAFDVFDRWGEHLFHGQDISPNEPSQGWDGRFHGKPMHPSTFTYFFELLMEDGTKRTEYGDVTIVR